MKFKKAQIFSLDIIFAVIIFIFIIIMLVNVWESSLEKTILKEQRNNLEVFARNIADLLILTEGYPSNWSISNISSLGLSASLSHNQLNSTYKSRPMGLNQKGAWNLDINKITALQSLNYSISKNLLGLSKEDENYYILISSWNNTDYIVEYSIGLAPYNNASAIVKVERFALLNNNWAKLDFNIWQECEERLCI